MNQAIGRKQLCGLWFSPAPGHVRRSWWCCLSLVPTLLFQAAVSAQESDWKKRFVEEAPKAWAQLETFYAQTEISYTETYKVLSPQNLPVDKERVSTLKFAVNDNLLRANTISKKKAAEIDLVNPHYKAHISQKGKNDSFIIELLVPNEPRTAEEVKQRTRFDKLKVQISVAAVYAPCYLWVDPLSSRIRDLIPGIVKVAPETREGKTLVRVDFATKPPGPTVEPRYLLLDPNSFWSLQEYEVDRLDVIDGNRFSTNVKVKLKYGEPIDGYPRLVRREQVLERNKTGYLTVNDTVIDSFAHKVTEPSEFTLSAYGLPEPHFDKPMFSVRVLYLAMAALLGLCAFIIWRRIRKGTAKAKP